MAQTVELVILKLVVMEIITGLDAKKTDDLNVVSLGAVKVCVQALFVPLKIMFVDGKYLCHQTVLPL